MEWIMTRGAWYRLLHIIEIGDLSFINILQFNCIYAYLPYFYIKGAICKTGQNCYCNHFEINVERCIPSPSPLTLDKYPSVSRVVHPWVESRFPASMLGRAAVISEAVWPRFNLHTESIETDRKRRLSILLSHPLPICWWNNVNQWVRR